ncbi:unnamed protein product, partial [Scytosiphon promiscuus]
PQASAQHPSVVSMRSCSHESCKRRPTFNVDGNTTALYCKQHAEEGMVYVFAKRCSHESCQRRLTSNVAGSKKAV